MTVTTAGTGTFTATGLTTTGGSGITITNIAKGDCSAAVSGGNASTGTITATTLALQQVVATNACQGSNPTIYIDGSGSSSLPSATYTVAYTIGAPFNISTTTNVTVSSGGGSNTGSNGGRGGSFSPTVSGIGQATVTVTSITNPTTGCTVSPVANNTAQFYVSGISTQPSDASVTFNADASFTVTPVGTPTSYQWQISTDNGTTWTNLSSNSQTTGTTYGGRTAATLTLTAPTTALNGYKYRVNLTYSTPTCNYTSNAVTLSVSCPATGITSQPSNSTISLLSDASFSVTAGGGLSTYVWEVSSNGTNWTTISAANTTAGVTYTNWTTATLGLTAPSLALSGYQYRVTASGGGTCSYTSNAATLTISCSGIAAPTVADQTINYGSNATFTASVAGTNTYQWQYSSDLGVNWSDVPAAAPYSGSTTNTLTITAPTASYTGFKYRVAVTNTDCNVTVNSVAATLTINCPYSLSAFAVTDICSTSTSTTFTLTQSTTAANLPDGTYTVTYDIGSPYAVTNATANMTVTSTGGAGGARGGTFTVSNLTQVGNPTATIKTIGTSGCTKTLTGTNTDAFYVAGVSVQPTAQSVTYNGNATFSVTAVGVSPSYQWQVSTDNGATFNNITSSTLTLSNTSISNFYSNRTTATMTVNSPPTAVNGYQYKVLVSTTTPSCTNIASNAVALNVACPTASSIITTSPTNQQIFYNSTATFSAVVTSASSTFTSSTYNPSVVGNTYITPAPTSLTNSGYIWEISKDGGTTWSLLTLSTGTGASGSGTFTDGNTNSIGFSVLRTGAASPYTFSLSLTAPTSYASGYKFRFSQLAGGCKLNSSEATLTVVCPVVLSSMSATDVTCTTTSTNSTVTLNAASTTDLPSGTYTVTYNVSSPVITGATATMTVLANATSGTFTATGLNTKGSSTITVTNLTYLVSSVGTCSKAIVANNTATVTVTTPPAYSTQPVNSTITYGANTSFSAGVVDATSYQWQVSVNNGVYANVTDGSVYSGSTTNTLSLTLPPGTYSGNKYKLIATGACSFTASSEVTLTVNKRVISITADAKSKLYGEADPTFTYTRTSTDDFVGTDGITLTRDAGESLGTYAIILGTQNFDANNYTLNYTGNFLTIGKRPLAITATAASKVYGDSDPTFAYTLTSGTLLSGDSWTGALGRASGEDVGTYAINIGTLQVTSNYEITLTPANLTITQRSITLTADAKSKVYGASDPVLTYTLSGPLYFTDAVTGSLSRVTGESVGTYAIEKNTIALSTNYDLTYVGADLTITAKSITVTANPQTKVYGDSDPLVFDYTVSPAIEATDSFSGTLSRNVGETVGTWAITQGSLQLSSDYNLIFVSDDLTITQRPITISADPVYKIYGDSDPALTFQVTSGSLAFTDQWVGDLNRDPGEDVNFYSIHNDNLRIYQGLNDYTANYSISYNGENFLIYPKSVTITADALSKTYGATDPVLTYTISPALSFTDTATGSLERAPGEDVGLYAVNIGSLNLSPNYLFDFVSSDFEITKATLTATADDKSRIYGDANPVFTISYSGFLNGDTEAVLDTPPIATTSADATSPVGPYAIVPSGGIDNNYSISYVDGTLTITQAVLTVTADDKSRIYGDANPAFTVSYTGFKNGENETVLDVAPTASSAASLTTAVGTYPITASGGSDNNYSFSYVDGTLTITQAALTVTAVDATRIYGDPNPTFQLTYAGFKNSETETVLDVAPVASTLADVTSPVGTYAITVTGGSDANYIISTYNAGTLTVTKRTITVTADAKSKIFGEVDPTLTYTQTGTLVNGDTYSGSLTRTAGDAPGTYPILQGSLSLSTDYDLVYLGANLTITNKVITVLAVAKTKVYGETDPVLTYTYSPSLVGGDQFSGAIERVQGENIGSYIISQGTLALSSSYTLTFDTALLKITKRPVTITADAKSKIYGDLDPSLTYQLTSGTLAFTEQFGGSLDRVTGENVGTYAINQGTVLIYNGATDVTSNYNLTYVSADLTITQRDVTITADSKTKTYGTLDPALTYQRTAGTLAFTDQFSGSLVRASGESVGIYAINQGDVTLGTNYNLTFISANLTITERALTVKADPITRVYGDVDPTLTYQIVSGSLASGDSFTGSLVRDVGDNVGDYIINKGTLAVGGNYTFVFDTALFSITPRPVTVTADAQSKTYGDADPTFTYNITTGNKLPTDNFSGALTRATGQNVGTYAILEGDLTLGSNYTLTYVGANLTIGIRSITVTASAQSKIYGDADPTLSYTSTPDPYYSDVYSGVLSRASGENVGTYAIAQNTLALNSNYAITYVPANLTITAKAITVTADNISKEYGYTDPTLTYTPSALLAFTDTFTGGIARISGEAVNTYSIIQGNLALSSNYTLTFVPGVFTINPREIVVTADPKDKAVGATDPTLTYTFAPALISPDVFTGSLTRVTGETLGSYEILQGTLALNSNYHITYNSAQFAIGVIPITVTANAKSKVYGASDPSFDYTITSGSLLSGDSFTGGLLRTVGENVGSYVIGKGDLALNSNYALTYVPADLTITKATLTVTADNNSRIYGATDPAFSVTYSGFQFTDDKTVLNTEPIVTTNALITSSVGLYNLIPGSGIDDNYSFNYVNGTYTITQATLTATLMIRVEFMAMPILPSPLLILALRMEIPDQFLILHQSLHQVPVYYLRWGRITLCLQMVQITIMPSVM